MDAVQIEIQHILGSTEHGVQVSIVVLL